MVRVMLLGIVLFTGCADPPAPIAPPATPDAATLPPSDAITRADAMIEDLRRRQAAETVSPARDEAWWKNRIRTQQARVQGHVDCMGAAVKRAESAGAQADFDRAVADAARCKADGERENAVLEGILEEGRSANVSPSWLRWP